MKDRVPIEVSEVPLTGFPFVQKLKLHVESASALPQQKADMFVVAVQQPPVEGKDEKKKDPVVVVNANADKVVKNEFSRLVGRVEFTGRDGKTAMSLLPSGMPFEGIGILGLGLGQPDQSTIVDGYTCAKGKSAHRLHSFAASKLGKPFALMTTGMKAKSVVLHVENSAFSPASLQSLVEHFLFCCFPDERFKTKSEEFCNLESFTVLIEGADASEMKLYEHAISRAKFVTTGVQLTRELAASPPNYCNPETLAKAAMQIAKDCGLKSTVLGEKACVERKMGAFLAVNQGSLYEPQFIHLTYTPEGPVKKKIAFIGKGICMNTGGYNLKTLGGIETMKMDMSGAAAVFGCASIVGKLKPKNVEIHFIVPAAENVIDSRAYRPGDIVKASNGMTIEIGNTDAEGRLTLADALIYAETEVKPDVILDCATLTGACIVALGQNIAGVYSQDSEWMATILQGAKNAGSPVWPMPLFSDYKKFNEGKHADIVNVPSSPNGGSISAAVFLREFVKETPWAHIDLAGPVFDPSSKEFTGFGAKMLAEIVFEMEARHK